METSQTKKTEGRIARPIFSTEPARSRVVEPTEGWPAFLTLRREACTEHETIWGCRVAEPLTPMLSPPEMEWEDEDPLIREWFKIGELLLAERS